MADERLRLVAEVQDQFTGPLSKMETALRRTASAGSKTAKDMAKDFEGFHGTLGKATSTLQGMLSPLQSLGVAGLGAGLGLSGIATALRSFSSGTQQLSILSKESGLAVDQLRALGQLGDRFGVSAETMNSGVIHLSEGMRKLKMGYGELQTSLLALNKGDFAEKLFNAKDMQAALDAAMEELSKEKDSYKRRQLAEVIFGTKDFGVIAGQVAGKYREVMQEIIASQGVMTKETEKAAAEFEKNMSRMGSAAERLKLNTLGPLLKGLNTIVESGDRAGIRGNAEAMDRDLNTRLTDATKRRAGLDPTKDADAIKSLDKEIRILTDAIRRSNDGAGPSVVSAIPMSFSGGGAGGGGGARIYTASFGGGGGGGFGGGSASTLGGFGGPLPTLGGGFGGGGASAGGNPNITGGGSGRGYGGGGPLGSSGAGVGAGPITGVPAGSAGRPISARDMRDVNPEMAEYIRQSARAHGIDPNVALRIANSEGLRGSIPGVRNTPGDKGTSFGPFQLHYASRIPGLTLGGLGDRYTKETGHHASDPRHWKEQIDFALRVARKEGWGAWHGRIGARIGLRDGIGTVPVVPMPEGRSAASADENGFFPNGAPRALKPLSMADDADVPGQVVGRGGPAGGRAGDAMMHRFYGDEAPVARGPAKGSLDITLHGFPAGTKPRASMDDLFKDVTVSKSRQMNTESI